MGPWERANRMSQFFINHYLAELDRLKIVDTIREAKR
jgi:hypothetical protein